jgi:hypothetical protein
MNTRTISIDTTGVKEVMLDIEPGRIVVTRGFAPYLLTLSCANERFLEECELNRQRDSLFIQCELEVDVKTDVTLHLPEGIPLIYKRMTFRSEVTMGSLRVSNVNTYSVSDSLLNNIDVDGDIVIGDISIG